MFTGNSKSLLIVFTKVTTMIMSSPNMDENTTYIIIMKSSVLGGECYKTGHTQVPNLYVCLAGHLNDGN